MKTVSMPSSSPSPAKPSAALTRAQGDDVLRYWLAAVRLEEALQARPGARQAPGGAVVPRLDQPSRGQDYFKVPIDVALTSLLAKGTDVQRAFDAELCGFFEGWLHRQYRRGEDEGELSHLLCFPVVHLPKGDLAGVLRVGVRLRFGAGGGAPFRAPSRAERQRGAYPAPPTEVRLTRGPKAEEEWPFFVDTRLLWQTLGTPAEHLDAFFEALRSLEAVSERRMLALLTVMLEDAATGSNGAPASTASLAERLKTASREPGALELEGWLTRLTDVVGRLLTQRGSRARVYGVGIVVDGTQAKTTWHLQRELESLLDGERGRWKLESPLGAYLTAKPLPASEEPQRALFTGPGLTPSQRAAADAFWGSRFSAVQGPPGTGKTRLILHLCAEHLTRHVEALLGTAIRRPGLLLVTSSNNRAVDNVLEPLTEGEGLPLALRAGSRQVCEHMVTAQLRRTLAWLRRAESTPLADRSARLAEAKRVLRERAEAVERGLAPRRLAVERALRRARLERELAEHGVEGEEASGAVSPASLALLLPALDGLLKRFEGLSRRCEGEASTESLESIERYHQRTSKRHLPAFSKALAEAQLTAELPRLPPDFGEADDVERKLERWEEAAESGVSTLSELRTRLVVAASRRRLREELEQLGADSVDEPFPALEESLGRELFAAAIAAREAWAGERATELAPAVALALRTVEDERSLRPLFRAEPDAARLFCRLFNVWGSTLLSLGNCLPADLGSVARVVIDEAGQCHPAHAVSALMRAEAALVIGDVHQLSPVVELGRDDEARLLRSCRLATPPARLLPYRVHADAEASSQSVADRAVLSRGLLTDHFRCQPEIIALSDELCGYGLTVHTARADRTSDAPFLTAPVSLVDLRGEQASWTGSWWNSLELEETLSLLDALLRGGVRHDEVAIITPYRGQLERLRRGLVERRIPLESTPELAESGGGGQPSGVALGTVHRFQGGERSVVLFSSVVTQHGSLGFLDARPNLLNVAISRAQHHFVCLGDASVLARGSRTRVLVNNARALPPRAYGSGLLL